MSHELDPSEFGFVPRSVPLPPGAILGAAAAAEAPPVLWVPDAIVAQTQPEGGRGLDVYESHLLFDRSELAGKRVLDLGCGPEVKFAKELEGAGIGAQVTSLSADFADKKYVHRALLAYPEAELVNGLGEKLPFDDESFDRIYSFFTHFYVYDEVAYIKEMARVLADHGEARIGPVTREDDFRPGDIISRLLVNDELRAYLGEQGVLVTRAKIPADVFRRRTHDPYSGTSILLSDGRVLILSKNKAWRRTNAAA